MSKWIKVAGLGIAGLAVLSGLLFGAVTAANAQAPTPAPVPPYGNGYGPHGMMGGGYGVMAQYREQIHAAIAQALGLTVEEFEAAIAAGKKLPQIAAEQGVAVEDVWAAARAAREAAIQQAVADGVITQEQANWMLSRMQQAARNRGGGRMGRMSNGFGPCPYGYAFPQTGS